MYYVEQLRVALGLPRPAAERIADPQRYRDRYGSIRKGYGGIRTAGLRILGPAYDAHDFDAMVRQEMEWQGVAETPRNWVTCGAEVLQQLRHRRRQEPDYQEDEE